MTTPPTSPTLAFEADLLRLMARHRYAGVPARVSTIIRAAATAGDHETLRERIPHAVGQMMHAESRR